MNKKVSKWLKQEAKQLPLQVGMNMMNQYISGAELKQDGYDSISGGKKIKDKNIYKSTAANSFIVDHYEVMKQLYLSQGKEAVLNYIQNARQTQLPVSASDTQKLSQEAGKLNG